MVAWVVPTYELYVTVTKSLNVKLVLLSRVNIPLVPVFTVRAAVCCSSLQV